MVTVAKYINDKQYNNNTCDMFLSALCNAMNMKVVVIRETNDFVKQMTTALIFMASVK